LSDRIIRKAEKEASKILEAQLAEITANLAIAVAEAEDVSGGDPKLVADNKQVGYLSRKKDILVKALSSLKGHDE